MEHKKTKTKQKHKIISILTQAKQNNPKQMPTTAVKPWSTGGIWLTSYIGQIETEPLLK